MINDHFQREYDRISSLFIADSKNFVLSDEVLLNKNVNELQVPGITKIDSETIIVNK